MNMRTITIINAIAILFITAMAICLATKARAYDELAHDYWASRSTDRTHCNNYGIDSACGYKSPNRVRRAQIRSWRRHQDDLREYRRIYSEPVHVERRTYKIERHDHGYGREDDHDERRDNKRRCEYEIAVVGDQYVSEDGARSEADKQFAQTSRYMFGERFMSKDNARNVSYECGRSSVGSVVGQVFYRCRMKGTPCSPSVQRGN